MAHPNPRSSVRPSGRRVPAVRLAALILFACSWLWPAQAAAQIKAVQPTVRTVSGGAGSFTFDYPAWAPTASVTLDMVGKARTISCVISPEVLRQFR